jgi:decaprenylphospho-beta-D-ribofuranose 2-oxidase
MDRGNSLPAVRRTFRSIDRTTCVIGYYSEPDRYRALLDWKPRTKIIPRGSGLSYVAASMADGATSVGLRHFNRIHRFDPANRSIEVEAGIQVGTLIRFLSEKGFLLPAVPGFPAITVGGCIACDIHGKNHSRHGSFGDNVLELELWHPSLGLRQIASGTQAFEATVGGLGLTGVIIRATLRIVPQPFSAVRQSAIPVPSLDEALNVMQEFEKSSDILYSWHDMSAAGRSAGYVIAGQMVAGGGDVDSSRDAPPRLDGWSLAAFNNVTIPIVNAAFARRLRSRHNSTLRLHEALFPLSGLAAYFRMFGERGLLEHQVLVPRTEWRLYTRRFVQLQRDCDVRIVVSSMKLFSASPRSISFTGNGIAFTTNLVNNSQSRVFLDRVDSLDCDTGSTACPYKDSRLPPDMFRRQQPRLNQFQEERARLDPTMIFESNLSKRLIQ